jgi:DNA-binding SARP family transcriptional activator
VVRIQLLGTVAVEVDGAPVALPPGRATELLAWLAAHPGMHARNRVAPVFWPDVADATARASLRTALWSLRKALGRGASALVVERAAVGLDGHAVWIDLHAADVDTSAGELVPGIEAEWADELRADHRERLAADLAAAAGAAAAGGDAAQAAALTRRLSSLDPYSEEHHRLLLRRLVDAGDQASALREHDQFRRRLWDDLRVRPSPATRELVASLRDTTPGVDAALPARLARARRDGFVARERELAQLAAEWRAVAAGDGPRVVLVTGEAGIGKTGLLARFAADIVEETAEVLFGGAGEDELLPAEPFLEAIGERHALAPLELADLVHERIERAAATRPLLLVLDDFHWADAVSLAVLRRLGRASSGRLMVLVAYRGDGDGHARLAGVAADLARDGRLARIALGPLTFDETSALLTRLDPGGALSGRAREVHGDTAGNPLFVSELGRYLLEAGAASATPRTAVPDTIRDLVIARMRQLTPQASDVIAAAAVLGADVEIDVLRAMVGAGDVLGALEESTALGIMDEQAAGSHVFRHAVVRDAVYDHLSKSRRAELHDRAAAAIAEVKGLGDGLHLCDVAEHRVAAVPPASADAAVAAAVTAARWALSQYVYERAVVVLTKALTLAEGPSRRELAVQRAIAYSRLTHLILDPAAPEASA